MTPPLWQKAKKNSKEPFDKSERGEWKSWPKVYIQKTKIMASGPITSWQIDGETMTEFILWGSQITADGNCSHEIKRCVLLERKVMTNLDSILKSRDITLLTKVHLVKAMVFLVVLYGCESWTIKKGEHWRTDAFELWYVSKIYQHVINRKKIIETKNSFMLSLKSVVYCTVNC